MVFQRLPLVFGSGVIAVVRATAVHAACRRLSGMPQSRVPAAIGGGIGLPRCSDPKPEGLK